MSWKWSTGIRSSLDACLLSDEEMVTFSEKLKAILQAKSSLRFASGDFVICQTATWPMPEVWKKGKVVALNYRGSDWPNDRADAPYAVLPFVDMCLCAACRLNSKMVRGYMYRGMIGYSSRKTDQILVCGRTARLSDFSIGSDPDLRIDFWISILY